MKMKIKDIVDKADKIVVMTDKENDDKSSEIDVFNLPDDVIDKLIKQDRENEIKKYDKYKNTYYLFDRINVILLIIMIIMSFMMFGVSTALFYNSDMTKVIGQINVFFGFSGQVLWATVNGISNGGQMIPGEAPFNVLSLLFSMFTIIEIYILLFFKHDIQKALSIHGLKFIYPLVNIIYFNKYFYVDYMNNMFRLGSFDISSDMLGDVSYYNGAYFVKCICNYNIPVLVGFVIFEVILLILYFLRYKIKDKITDKKSLV